MDKYRQYQRHSDGVVKRIIKYNGESRLCTPIGVHPPGLTQNIDELYWQRQDDPERLRKFHSINDVWPPAAPR